MRCRPIPCWIPSKNLDLMPASEAQEEMKKKPGRKKEFSQCGTNSDSGIPKDNGPNSGISITARFKKEKTFVCFQSVTGQNWIYGIIYVVKKLNCRLFISHTKEM